ncbi:nuclear fragile X mental retardation-interacting protein 1 [Engraulis encrasicolus]|uniref:nuclear fragile X mental retardation-interacting protein 1 n=1 Tax=Engraulis encrasicolus TaxID=184585 RepID=UPI002FD1433A
MTNPGSYPSPVFDCPPQAPVLKASTFQFDSSSEPSKFQATRDWSWSERQPSYANPPQHPPGPWTWNQNPHGNWQGGNWHHQNYGQNRHRGGQQHHHHGRQDFGGKKKNKREPEFSFFCDTCDRGFKAQDKYDEHMSQHVKCSVADCTFTAHEKVVRIHWNNNHAPGTKRIKLDTPEEIAKWREERKRNYPTLANVEKKMKVMEAKEERGEVLETAQFGRMKGRGRGRGRGRGGRGRGGGFRGRGGWGRDCSSNSNHTGGADEPQQQQQQAASQRPKEEDPLGALANSDPDSDVEGPVQVSVAPKAVSSGLASLVASYGDMTDSESEQEAAAPILKTSKALEENKALLNNNGPPRANGPPHTWAQSQSYPGGPPSHPRGPPQGSAGPWANGGAGSPGFHPSRGGGQGRGRGRKRGGRGGRGGHNAPHPHRHTLLEMLLAPDIRHERNVLLQCVRFIVRNGFFGLETKDGGHSEKKDGVDNIMDVDSRSGTARKRSDVTGAGDDTRSPPSENCGINGRTLHASQTSARAAQNGHLGDTNHQPSRRSDSATVAMEIDDTVANGTPMEEERPMVTDMVTASASQGVANTQRTVMVYDDDIWEMDEVSTTEGNSEEPTNTSRAEEPANTITVVGPADTSRGEEAGITTEGNRKELVSMSREEEPTTTTMGPASTTTVEEPDSTDYTTGPASTTSGDRPGSRTSVEEPGSTTREQEPGNTSREEERGSTTREQEPGNRNTVEGPGNTSREEEPYSAARREGPISTTSVEGRGSTTREQEPDGTAREDRPESTTRGEGPTMSTTSVEEPVSTTTLEEPEHNTRGEESGNKNRGERPAGDTTMTREAGSDHGAVSREGTRAGGESSLDEREGSAAERGTQLEEMRGSSNLDTPLEERRGFS